MWADHVKDQGIWHMGNWRSLPPSECTQFTFPYLCLCVCPSFIPSPPIVTVPDLMGWDLQPRVSSPCLDHSTEYGAGERRTASIKWLKHHHHALVDEDFYFSWRPAFLFTTYLPLMPIILTWSGTHHPASTVTFSWGLKAHVYIVSLFQNGLAAGRHSHITPLWQTAESDLWYQVTQRTLV